MEYLSFFRYKTTKEPISTLRIGDEISIYTDEGVFKDYVITGVEVRDIFDNLELMNFGAHSEDCEEISGKEKKCLFSIFVTMDLNK